MSAAFKWTSPHKDDITGATITYIKGHELYGDSYVVARVFSERVEAYRYGPKELRHFAVVEDEDKEVRWETGKAHKSIKTAKAEAEKYLIEALARRSQLSGVRRKSRRAKRAKAKRTPARDSKGRFKKRK